MRKLTILHNWLTSNGFREEALECRIISSCPMAKKAAPYMTNLFSGEKEFIQDKDIRKAKYLTGGFVYVLKLKATDGDAPFRWYVGETTSPIVRYLEHKFPMQKVEDSYEVIDRNEITKDVMADVFSGSKWTLKHEPVELVCLELVSDPCSVSNSSFRKQRENRVTEELAQFVGSENIYGGSTAVMHGIRTQSFKPKSIDEGEIKAFIRNNLSCYEGLALESMISCITRTDVTEEDETNMAGRHLGWGRLRMYNASRKGAEDFSKISEVLFSPTTIEAVDSIKSLQKTPKVLGLNFSKGRLIKAIFNYLDKNNFILIKPDVINRYRDRSKTFVVNLFLKYLHEIYYNGGLDPASEDNAIAIINEYILGARDLEPEADLKSAISKEDSGDSYGLNVFVDNFYKEYKMDPLPILEEAIERQELNLSEDVAESLMLIVLKKFRMVHPNRTLVENLNYSVTREVGRIFDNAIIEGTRPIGEVFRNKDIKYKLKKAIDALLGHNKDMKEEFVKITGSAPSPNPASWQINNSILDKANIRRTVKNYEDYKYALYLTWKYKLQCAAMPAIGHRHAPGDQSLPYSFRGMRDRVYITRTRKILEAAGASRLLLNYIAERNVSNTYAVLRTKKNRFLSSKKEFDLLRSITNDYICGVEGGEEKWANDSESILDDAYQRRIVPHLEARKEHDRGLIEKRKMRKNGLYNLYSATRYNREVVYG